MSKERHEFIATDGSTFEASVAGPPIDRPLYCGVLGGGLR